MLLATRCSWLLYEKKDENRESRTWPYTWLSILTTPICDQGIGLPGTVAGERQREPVCFPQLKAGKIVSVYRHLAGAALIEALLKRGRDFRGIKLDRTIDSRLEQQRAKEYWERVWRFKAQEEEQRKSREAHEKKQLEYMRMAGIKLNEVEKEQKEDARKLKLFGAQRPSLISRPQASSASCPKSRRPTRPSLRGFLSSSGPSQIKIKNELDGHGTGWVGARGGLPPKLRTWCFPSLLTKVPAIRSQRVLHFTDFTYCRRTTAGSLQRRPRHWS